MNNQELQACLAENSQVEPLFMEKALAYLNEQNMDKLPARRLNDTMIQREADKLFDQVLDDVNQKIAQQAHGNTSPETWRAIIEQTNLIEQMEDSMSELEFGAQD